MDRNPFIILLYVNKFIGKLSQYNNFFSFLHFSKSKKETQKMASPSWNLQDDIETDDPEMHDLIKKEKERQKKGLEMIASENFASKSVLQALGSCLNNKYSEGQPGQR